MSTIDRRKLEREIVRIGKEIFERADDAAPPMLSIEYAQAQAMQWMTRHEGLKLQLFRFIEALPSLSTSRDVADCLKRHLGEEATQGEEVPFLLKLAVGFRSSDSLHAGLSAWAARRGCLLSARQFICGSTPEEAVKSVLRMRRQGMTFTLDVLGETVTSDAVARELQGLYIHLIESIGAVAPAWPTVPLLDQAPWGSIPKVNISIKLTGIVASFSPGDPETTTNLVLDRLRPVFRAAMKRGAFVNVDMEHYAVKALTFDIFKKVLDEPEFRDWPDCGIVSQAYLREAEADMAELIAWARRRATPLTVRLVKGAYWDSETAIAQRSGLPSPVYSRKHESDACFERISAVMLQNADIIRPAFASHNVRSIAAALAMEQAIGLPPNTIELQMLTGMGDPLKRAVVAMNQRLRVYSPFGNLETGMAYLIRRLIENTANESFLRQSFGGNLPIDELLADPARLAPAGPAPIAREKSKIAKPEPTVLQHA